MLWKDIIAIASSILLSIGGAGVLICGFSSFLAERIAKRIDNKYQQKLDQELETFRSLMEHRKFVSKTQFDYEFQLYKELSKVFFDVAIKYSSFSYDHYKKGNLSIKNGDITKEEIIAIINVAYNAQNVLFENAAFLPEEIYNAYYELYNRINMFFWKVVERIEDVSQKNPELENVSIQCDLSFAETIETELSEINKKVRKRIESFVVH